MRLSLVVPAYREEVVIKDSLDAIYDFFEAQGLSDDAEVVVVTADSPDHTQQIVAEQLKRFKHAKHVQPGVRVGKGRDVRAGVQASSGDVIIFTDADLATPLHHVPEMLKMLEGEYKVAIGVRKLSNIHQGFRYYISNVSNIIIQLVLLPGIKDSQCGFKGFTREAAEIVFSRLTILQWGFDMEVLKICREHKIKVATVPVLDWRDPKLESGLSGDSALKVVFKTFREMWQIRLRSWEGKYK